VQFSTRTLGPLGRHAGAASAPDEGQTPEPTRQGRWSGRRVLPIAAGAAVLVVAGGTVAYANVDKSVTLDVDGNVSHAHTFQGSVAAFLADRGVKVGVHEGDEIVVRHGHLITVQVGGQEKKVWTTALSADDALDTLAARDGDVRLVASRSASNGRAELPLDLTVHGPAQIVVDGQTIDVPDADAKLAQILDEQHVTLGPLDRVSVAHGANGVVQVVVNRVAVNQVTSTEAVAFDTTQTQDGSLLQGQQKVTTAGVNGVRTIVTQVTTVDGVVTDQVQLSNDVTTAPVAQVVAVGTKAPAPATKVAAAPKPASTPAAPKPAAAPATSSTPATGGGAAGSLNWAALAKCESGGNPGAVSPNGLYYGLYQFSVQTWRAMGGSGLPTQASPAEQTARAQDLYNRSGAGQWPVCGKNLFT
jgi:resuscitation-promoting factor RpfB